MYKIDKEKMEKLNILLDKTKYNFDISFKEELVYYLKNNYNSIFNFKFKMIMERERWSVIWQIPNLIKYIKTLDYKKDYSKINRVLIYMEKMMKVGKIDPIYMKKADLVNNPLIREFVLFDTNKLNLLLKILLIFVDNNIPSLFKLYKTIIDKVKGSEILTEMLFIIAIYHVYIKEYILIEKR
jgi:hypothetical protein